MSCQRLSSLGPFLARLLLVDMSPLPASWTRLHPSHAFLSRSCCPVPTFPALVQSICASGQRPPLALSKLFSIQQPNKPMLWFQPAFLPQFPLFHTELLLLPFKPCSPLHWLCWFCSYSSRKPSRTPLPTPLESCGFLGMAHCLFLYKMSLCLY